MTETPAEPNHLLAVEDNPNWQERYRYAGAQAGITVDVEHRVTAAYWRFAEHPSRYLAAVVDLNLGHEAAHLDGIDLIVALLHRAERAERQLPIVCRTSAGSHPRLDVLASFYRDGRIAGILDKTKEEPKTLQILERLRDGDLPFFRPLTDAFLTRVGAVLAGEERAPSIKWEGTIQFGGTSPRLELTEAEANSVVRCVCRPVLGRHFEITAEPLPPGYSGCVPVQIYTGRVPAARNYLLKLGVDEPSHALLSQEVRNYDRFAAGIKASAPLLLAHITCEQTIGGQRRLVSAVVYELVGFTEIRQTNFSTHILEMIKGGAGPNPKSRRKEVEKRCSIQVGSLVKPLQSWYAPRQQLGVSETSRLITQLDRYVEDADKIPGDWYSRSATRMLNYPHDTLPDPVDVARQVLRSGWRYPALTAGTIHGDLNCRNIIRRDGRVDRDLSLWALIDFEDVADRQHVLLDLATLECDLKFKQRAHFTETNGINLGELQKLARMELELAIDNQICDAPPYTGELRKLLKWLGKGTLSWQYWVIQEQIRQLRIDVRLEFWEREDRKGLWAEWNAALLCTSLRYFTYRSDDISRRYAWFAAAVAAVNVQHTLLEQSNAARDAFAERL